MEDTSDNGIDVWTGPLAGLVQRMFKGTPDYNVQSHLAIQIKHLK